VIVWADDRLDLGIYAQNINGAGQFGVFTSLDDATKLSSFRIQPNPSYELNVQFGYVTTSTLILTMTDAAGRLMYTEEIPTGTSSLRIPATQQFASGTYILKFVLSDNPAHYQILRWVK